MEQAIKECTDFQKKRADEYHAKHFADDAAGTAFAVARLGAGDAFMDKGLDDAAYAFGEIGDIYLGDDNWVYYHVNQAVDGQD